MKTKQYLICINNSDFPASLEPRKLYEQLEDEKAATLGQVRVIDESGEDYLYPAERFISLNLSPEVVQAVTQAA